MLKLFISSVFGCKVILSITCLLEFPVRKDNVKCISWNYGDHHTHRIMLETPFCFHFRLGLGSKVLTFHYWKWGSAKPWAMFVSNCSYLFLIPHIRSLVFYISFLDTVSTKRIEFVPVSVIFSVPHLLQKFHTII